MSPFFSRSELVPELEKIGIRLDKNRGQCFLVDRNLAEYIVGALNITEKDTVMEIGPGLGTLSDYIQKKAQSLYLIENDNKVANYLSTHFKEMSNVTIIHGDCLRVKWPSVNKVISNVPYQISGLLFAQLAETSFERGVFMVQKEFAERMVAPPNSSDYSRLTVIYSLYFKVKILKNVANTVFHPKPAVDSAIILVEPLEKNEKAIRLRPLLFHLLHGIFPYKGKMLRRGMKDFINASTKGAEFTIAMEEFLEMYEDSPILSQRIRAITPSEYLQITEELSELMR